MSGARGGTVLTVVCAALVLTACGPRSQETLLPEEYVDPPAVSEAARAAYGEGATEAYEEVADFLLEHATDEDLVNPSHGTPTEAELTEVTDMMTDQAAQAWRTAVAADLAGDPEARDVVRLLRFHTWESDLQAPRVGEIVRSQSVTDGSVDVVGSTGDGASATATATPTDGAARTGEPAGPGLEIELTHQARLRLVADDVPVDVTLERPLVLTVVREGDRWLINTFEGTLTVPSEMPADGPPPIEESVSTTAPGR